MTEEKKRVTGAQAVHQVLLTDRQQLKLEGVVNVVHFSDSEVSIETTGGVLFVKGQGLHIQQLNLDDGRLSMTGTIESMVYAGETALKKGKGFLTRMFK